TPAVCLRLLPHLFRPTPLPASSSTPLPPLPPLSPFFFLMIRRPPRSTLFPTRRSSRLPAQPLEHRVVEAVDQAPPESDLQQLGEGDVARPLRLGYGATRLKDVVRTERQVGLDADPALHRHLGRHLRRMVPCELTPI